MIRIQEDEKKDPREIGNRQGKINHYRDREALKAATQSREEQNSISRPRIRRGNQEVDLLLLQTKHDVVLPELRKKASKLESELKLTDELIASSKRTTSMPDEPEKRAELAKLLRKITEIESTSVSGGKRCKRKTFRRTKSKKSLKRTKI